MHEYLELLTHIMMNGIDKKDRTGVGTRSIFGYQMRFDLQEGFPAVTVKKLAWKSVVSELLWFLEGSSDERRLAEIHYGNNREKLIDKRTIWTANADHQGKNLGYINNDAIKELGPIYGSTWRNWNNTFIDQIDNVVKSIKNDPDSRRHIVSSWNVEKIKDMTLPPCHTMFQFYVSDDSLSCQLYQRSGDAALGIPFNIASYSLLVSIIASICDLQVGEFILTIGDAHIYHNHVDGVNDLLIRSPMNQPNLKIPELKSLDDIKKTVVDDYVLLNYSHHPPVFFPMAV